MPFAEEDLLPISALQHLLFCPRQCALIHVEQLWAENRLTAEGGLLHRRAHEGRPETRDGERATRGLPLRSLKFGLFGKADVVLWRPPNPKVLREQKSLRRLLEECSLAERRRWIVTPVEYKRGRPKKDDSDRVQLCAQAICLEEMLDVEITVGELYYGERRRRFEVSLDAGLRETTTQAAAELHKLIASRRTPPASRLPKCDSCSLIELCMPDLATGGRSAQQYLRSALDSLPERGQLS